MSECGRVELHERLPEYVHGALDAPQREQIEAHLLACADARRELALVRAARDAIVRRTPVVDPNGIMSAVRAARLRPRAVPVYVISRRAVWRIAAAVALVATGALGYWIGTRRAAEHLVPDYAVSPVNPSLTPEPLSPVASPAPAPKLAPAPSHTPERAVAEAPALIMGDPNDLDEKQVGAILIDLEQGGASFETEPSPDFDFGSGQ